jgi:hypothetical protein
VNGEISSVTISPELETAIRAAGIFRAGCATESARTFRSHLLRLKPSRYAQVTTTNHQRIGFPLALTSCKASRTSGAVRVYSSRTIFDSIAVFDQL